ncbi:MAG TPA: XdhC/CoxI family protein [Candidatus Cloacimonadota bacterium]|nr:XdhC/CoxI family protein [Candidatus Cloacimonadota bacterium]
METAVFNIIAKAAENQRRGIPFVLATVVQGVEKTPGRSGFKLISYADKSMEGTVGGGTLERMVLDKCAEIHRTHQNELLEFELTASGIGMVCGGKASVFFEYFAPLRKVFVFGAGHLCRSLVPILDSLGFYCIVIDNREEFASQERLPQAKEVLRRDYLDFVHKFQPSENDAIVIFTHGHSHDFDIIDALCRRNVPAKYIGMIGSKLKIKQAVHKVKRSNYSGDLIEKIYAPIGLNIGKTTTQEIAIAIAAEMLAVYNGVEKIEFLKDVFQSSEEPKNKEDILK